MRTPTEIAEAFSPATLITADRPFYLVGIGGAGMSALAVMLQKRGIPVSGSDSTESSTTVSLREAGIPVRIGHSGEDIRSDQQVVLSNAIFTDCHDFRQRAVHPYAPVAILAKHHWLAVFEIQHAIGTNRTFSEMIERVVVKDVAVLVDLDKRNALVLRSRFNHRAEMFDVDIDRTGHKRRLTRDRE